MLIYRAPINNLFVDLDCPDFLPLTSIVFYESRAININTVETSGETTTFVSYATAFNAIFLIARLVSSRMISLMTINS